MRRDRASLLDVDQWEKDHAKRYPPPERSLVEAMYDRVHANPGARTLIVTRLEWQLLKAACGWGSHPEAVAPEMYCILGYPVVILEDGELSW
jgi:hypothetical protein